MRLLLNDFESRINEEETFLDYYDKQGQKYFYDLLKPLSDVDNIKEDEFIDWGYEKPYVKSIGVGECAGVVLDLVSTILFESKEKLEYAQESYEAKQWSDSIYHSYTSLVNSAKALLVADGVKTNTQAGIIEQFEAEYIENNKIKSINAFAELAYQIKENKPTAEFAKNYLAEASTILQKIEEYRLESELIKN